MQIQNTYDMQAPTSYALRNFLQKVYGYMTGALALTGLSAWFSAHSPAMLNALYVMQDGQAIGLKPLSWVLLVLPLFLVMFMSAQASRLNFTAAQFCFWSYAAIMGVSLSVLFLAFTGESIARVFFITAGAFGALSLFGYTTKARLTRMGSFLLMSLFGLIIASLVNLFLKSSGFYFVISALGVLIFSGLTAFDAQRLKTIYAQNLNEGMLETVTIQGALTLYLDFLNLFMNLLPFLGKRK